MTSAKTFQIRLRLQDLDVDATLGESPFNLRQVVLPTHSNPCLNICEPEAGAQVAPLGPRR